MRFMTKVSLVLVALVLSNAALIASASDGYRPTQDDSTTHTGKTRSSSR